MIDEYKERTGLPPPPNFDTLKMTFHIMKEYGGTQEITLEVDMARFRSMRDENDPFSVVPINTAGKQVCRELACVLNSNGLYSIHYKKDMEQYKKIAAYKQYDRDQNTTEHEIELVKPAKLDSYVDYDIRFGDGLSSRKSNYVHVEEYQIENNLEKNSSLPQIRSVYQQNQND